MRRTLVLCSGLLIALTGCASYTPSSAQIPKAAGMPAWRTEGAVGAGADPYVQPDRQKAMFGGNLRNEGVLAVQVLVENRGDRRQLVRRSEIALGLPDGTQFSPSNASSASAKLQSIGGVVGSTIAFGLIGFLVSSSANEQASAARLADYQSKELQDVTLGKDQPAHGFVYFIPPAGTQAFNEATLSVRFVDAEDATGLVVRLPMTGLEFKKTD